MTASVDHVLNRARSYPLDRDDEDEPAPCPDAAHWAARVLLADLMDRRGIRQEVDQWDTDTQIELVADLATLIRQGWGNQDVQTIVEAVVADLSGRGGVDQTFDTIDEDVLEEMKESLAELLVAAYAVEPPR